MKKTIIIVLLALSGFTGARAQSVDYRILKSINGPVHPAEDRAMNFISNQAMAVEIATPVTMFATGLITHDRDLKVNAIYTGESFLFSGGAAFFLKKIVKRERPYITHPDIVQKAAESGYSFPSAHASLAFSTATCLSIAYPKWYVIAPSYLFAGTVSYSRLYLGVHYPSDVLGGAIIGTASAFVTYKVQKLLNKKGHSPVDNLIR